MLFPNANPTAGTLYGGADNDLIAGRATSVDRLFGGEGDDYVLDDYDDSLGLPLGWLYGGLGRNSLLGRGGDEDVVAGKPEEGVIAGKTGEDVRTRIAGDRVGSDGAGEVQRHRPARIVGLQELDLGRRGDRPPASSAARGATSATAATATT